MMLRLNRVLALGLGLSLGLSAGLGLAAVKTPAAKAPVKASPKNPAPARTSGAVNPNVPYRYANNQQAMIPKSISDILANPKDHPPETLDFLRSIPLEVNGYAEAETLSSPFKTSDDMLALLGKSDSMVVHMEALRRGYTDLPRQQQKDLVVKLLKRYQTAETNPVYLFDYGYAQLVYLNHQNGLMFLRQASERMKNPFVSMAYAMGQAEVDLYQENKSPSETTTRKMDVQYKLGDALAMDVQEHHPGFWPSYTRVIQKLAQYPAYQGYTKRDFSYQYVQAGKKPEYIAFMALTPSLTQAGGYNLLATGGQATPASDKATKPQAAPTSTTAPSASAMPISIQHVPNTEYLLLFYKTEQPGQYKGVMMDAKGQAQLSFTSLNGTSVLEDLDKDNVYELVLRQYPQAPFDPVRIYRLTPTGYQLDETQHQRFL